MPYVIPYIKQRPNPAGWCCETLFNYIGIKFTFSFKLAINIVSDSLQVNSDIVFK
jgi:hypothetical protein